MSRLVCTVLVACIWIPAFAAEPAGVAEIGTRRELFVDDGLVERLGGARSCACIIRLRKTSRS